MSHSAGLFKPLSMADDKQASPMDTKLTANELSNQAQALDQCFHLCEQLCTQKPKLTTAIIDTLVSRLTGVDVVHLFSQHQKIFKAHYLTKKTGDQDSELLGWQFYHYLPLLIRNYFHCLFFLKQKNFQQFTNDNFTKALVNDSKFYNRIMKELKNEIILALECLYVERQMLLVRGITEAKQQEIEKHKLIECITQHVIALNENATLLLPGGWSTHSLIIPVRKLKIGSTGQYIIEVEVDNAGSGVSPKYPTQHRYTGQSHHNYKVDESNTRYVSPRIVGTSPVNNPEKFKRYLEGLLSSYCDKDKGKVQSCIYDYSQYLDAPMQNCDMTFVREQESDNCLTYCYELAQKTRISECSIWLKQQVLRMIQQLKLVMHPSDIQTWLRSYQYQDPKLEVLHGLLSLSVNCNVRLLDTVQLKTMMTSLTKEEVMAGQDLSWTRTINDCLNQLFECKKIIFYQCGLTDQHITPFLDILKMLPNVTYLDLRNVNLSSESINQLLLFIKSKHCHLTVLDCEVAELRRAFLKEIGNTSGSKHSAEEDENSNSSNKRQKIHR